MQAEVAAPAINGSTHLSMHQHFSEGHEGRYTKFIEMQVPQSSLQGNYFHPQCLGMLLRIDRHRVSIWLGLGHVVLRVL